MTKKIILFLILVGILFVFNQNKKDKDINDLSISELIKENVKNIEDPNERNNQMIKIALESYHLLNEKNPKTLDELVPDYLDEVPLNTETNKPFSIREFLENNKIINKAESTSQKSNKNLKNNEDTIEIKKEAFKYVSNDKKDPFTLKDVENNKNEPKGMLNLKEFENLRLTAIISDGKEKKAMIEDENGKGYILKIGSKVGSNTIVSNITNKSIILKETSYNFKNKKNEVLKEINLRN